MKKEFINPEMYLLSFQKDDVLNLSESNLGQYDKTTEDGDWDLPNNW